MVTETAKPATIPRAKSSMVKVYIVFLNYSIFLIPCFTGMREGAGAGAGSDGGGAGLSLAIIASRW